MEPFEYTAALLSGATAGLCVDITLFPLDTVKTRLQSSEGFWRSGGFNGIYSGLRSAMIGSAPSAAMFFMAYESSKNYLSPGAKNQYQLYLVHKASAAFGEIMACIVRVPCEVIKQRAQASPGTSQLTILRQTIKTEGFLGLYRGYTSTVIREIPFSFIQFPLWELFKSTWSRHQGRPVDGCQSAICGATAGGIAAAVTTPLDVAKTRIMLAESGTYLSSGSIINAIKTIYQEQGMRGLFAGVQARVPMIAVGGAIFLGVYDRVHRLLLETS